MTTPTPNTMDATAPGEPLPGRFRLATTTNPGAVAVIEWFDASDAALTELSGLKSPWPVGRLRHAMLAGIDDGLIGRVSDRLVHLQPHGGPRVVQKLAAWLFDRGVTPAPTVPPVLAFPEAQSEHEARRLATLAIADSPAAATCLLAPGRKSLESSSQGETQAKPLPGSMRALEADLDPVLVDAEGNRPDLAAAAIAALPEALRPLARLIQAPTVVVAGAPNAGKSTLLNRLVGKTAAVVSDQPGTTRDYVSQAVGLPTDLGELVVRWLDTPGLRTSDDGIEQQAIAIARKVMQDADVLIALREPNTNWPHLPRTPDLWLTTKADTPAPAPGSGALAPLGAASGLDGNLGHAAETPLAISAQTGQGIAELKQAVAACLGF